MELLHFIAVVMFAAYVGGDIRTSSVDPISKDEITTFTPKIEATDGTTTPIATGTTVSDQTDRSNDDQKIFAKFSSAIPQPRSTLKYLCQDILENNETCHHLIDLLYNEEYFSLTWELTSKIILQKPFGIMWFIFWTISLCILNLVILLLCTMLAPIRGILLSRIVSDLRRRYYFTNDSELRVIDDKPRK